MKKRILIRGVNWLGDAVMSTPALMAIRRNAPDASIIMLCHSKLEDLWRHHPAVDEVISFNRGEGLFRLAQRLREARPDIAVVFPNSTRSALEVWKAGIKTRIGYGGRWRSLFLNKVVKRHEKPSMRKRTDAEIKALINTDQPRGTFPKESHHSFDYLHLVGSFFGPASETKPILRVNGAEILLFQNKFKIPPGQLLLGLNPGAEYGSAKRWPTDRFIESAKRLHQLTGCAWLIFGGSSDEAVGADIETAVKKSGCTVINLAGRTSLRELCAGFKCCQLLLTNDTGPMHVAAALDVPVVVPFGSTSPELTGPGDPSKTSSGIILGEAQCAPCFRRACPIDFRCMRRIEVNQVVAEVMMQLDLAGT